jgi:hypothetical protein
MPEDIEEGHIPRKYLIVFYSLLLALGLIIYLAWGLMYGSWNLFDRANLGIYAVTLVLCGFGIVGILLYTIGDKKSQ